MRIHCLIVAAAAALTFVQTQAQAQSQSQTSGQTQNGSQQTPKTPPFMPGLWNIKVLSGDSKSAKSMTLCGDQTTPSLLFKIAQAQNTGKCTQPTVRYLVSGQTVTMIISGQCTDETSVTLNQQSIVFASPTSININSSSNHIPKSGKAQSQSMLYFGTFGGPSCPASMTLQDSIQTDQVKQPDGSMKTEQTTQNLTTLLQKLQQASQALAALTTGSTPATSGQ